MFNSSGSKFKFDSQFIQETKKLGNCENFNEILSYLNSLKLFDKKVLKEIFKENNLKKFKIEILQSIFEFSQKNYKILQNRMNKKLKILKIYLLNMKAKDQTDDRLESSLSNSVNWELFDRLVLDFDSILIQISKEIQHIYTKERISKEDVSFLNIFNFQQFLRVYYHQNENLKDLLEMMFTIPMTLTKITYFLIFHLDLSTKSLNHLPMFNFLLELTKFFKSFQKKKEYILAKSLITAEYGVKDNHLKHFLNLINLVKTAIGINDFSLENTRWVNFILELEVNIKKL